MKKLMNVATDYVPESLAGMAAAHPEVYALTGASKRVVARATPKPTGRVGVITGGGFGHLPLFAGYVGEGLLDACAVGDVFAGPSADSVSEALAAADRGAGVLAIIGNYGGDRLAFGMATDALEDRGVPVATVIGNDDVSSATPDEADKRRGVAGIIFAFKVAGAAAEAGWPLDRVAGAARQAVERCRTIGVALSPCTIPTRGQPTFQLEDDAIEMGMGIHGEKGVWRGPLKPADALVDEMIDRLVSDQPIGAGERIAVLCNSLGATPLEELFILYRRISQRVKQIGATVAVPMVGHYVTSMEMAGASISVLRLTDELEGLLKAPTSCPYWRTP